jgi:hypothetical protein
VASITQEFYMRVFSPIPPFAPNGVLWLALQPRGDPMKSYLPDGSRRFARKSRTLRAGAAGNWSEYSTTIPTICFDARAFAGRR